jgi:hypothetical protein
MSNALIVLLMWEWEPPVSLRPRQRRTPATDVDAATASLNRSCVYFLEVPMPGR